MHGVRLPLVAGACLLVAVAGWLHLAGSPATATVALMGVVPPAAAAAEADSVELTGPGGPARLDPRHARLGHAPDPGDLGTFTVPAGRYRSIRLRSGGRTLVASVDLRLAPSALEPLLLVVDGPALTAYAGNAHLDEGLLTASGQRTPVPDVTFTDQDGSSVPFHSLRGRVTVVAAITTHCHESCPLYAELFDELQRTLDARGWGGRVNLVAVTMDPKRDTPAVLAAYTRVVGARWRLLTGSADTLRIFWGALGATWRDAPYPGTPPTDWYTGGPEAYHVDHDSLAVVVDQDGDARFRLLGNPRLGSGLRPALTRLFDPHSSLAELESTATWSPTDLLDRVDLLLGEPAEAMRAPEAAARPGDTAPPLSLHALGGGPVSLTAEAGHPVVLNFWATWCTPCRAELPRLERAAADDPGLRVLAVDEGEAAGDVAAFLRGIPGAPGTMRVLLDPDRAAGSRYQVLGLPVSVFVDAGGTVRAVHVGEIDAADLEDALRMLR